MAEFNELVADFSQDVDFVLVYCQEAHALDGWNILNTLDYEVQHHRNIDDRIEAAKILQTMGYTGPLIVDTMSNSGAHMYGALPESLFIIDNGKITYKALGPFAYDPQAVRKMLEKKLGKGK